MLIVQVKQREIVQVKEHNMQSVKQLTKKQRKAFRGANAAVLRSINSRTAEKFTYSDGSEYSGLPAKYVNLQMLGLGYKKVQNGIPFVKTRSALG